MNIGIDLDDTISKTDKMLYKYAKKFNKENKIKYKIRKNEWDFDKAFGWNEENEKDFFSKYIKCVFESVKIKKNAKKYINILKKDNKIFIITARSEQNVKNVLTICKEWLEKYGVKVDKIIVDGNDKANQCRQNNIDIFIDDRNI